jgi:hypothetical protein
MYKYAQINENGMCFGLSEISGEVDNPFMILLIDEDIRLGDIFLEGIWTRYDPEPEPIPEPEPTAEQIRIEQLEADNAALWYENMIQSAKVEANETEVSALWYEVMMLGGV